MTIFCGIRAGSVLRRMGGVIFLSVTKTFPSRCSTDQHATELKAGARKAAPVRRLKQA
jgi:hypothetical protein